MIRYKVLQLLFLVISMTSQALIKGMETQKKEIGEGIAQRIEELPKELRYDILSSALALRENPKYEIYKKFDVGSQVRGIALTKDNTRALTGLQVGIARIWNVENGRLLKELPGHTNTLSSVALSSNDSIVLTGSLDGTARVWNMDTGELLKTLQVGSEVYSVALNADGTIALTGAQDRIPRLYNTSTGELIKELEGHNSNITSVALSADGTLALTGSLDGTARVWNTGTGELLNILQVSFFVNSVALSADGTSALIKTANNEILVWDTKTGALLNRLFSDKIFSSVALSKDGKRALVGTNEGSIQIWNTKPLPGKAETNTPLTELEGHKGPVRAVAFGSADFIASGSDDRTALIWKPFALEPRGPQEHPEVLRQAYKETFSRPLLRSTDEK